MLEFKRQYINTAVIGKFKWDKVKDIVKFENLTESLWYNRLSDEDLSILNRCIEI